MTEYVEQLRKRLRRARRARNAYWVAAIAVPAAFACVFVYQDRFNALQLALEKIVVAEVVIVGAGSEAPHGIVVQYEVAGKIQRGFLVEPGLPEVMGVHFPVRVRVDTGTLVGSTHAQTLDADPPNWKERAIPLLCGFFPFALLGWNYESRRRSVARNIRGRG